MPRSSTRTIALAQAAVPITGLWTDLVIIVGFSLLMAACARISFYLPFSVVPYSAQTFGLLLAGATLGSKRGALAMLAYLAEGAAGLPVFAGGLTGATTFFGPTAGYLFSFPIVAFVVGSLAERGWDRRFLTTALAMLLGTVIVYACGVAWLSLFVGFSASIFQGILVFLPGDAAKLLLASAVMPSAWMVLGRARRD